MDNSEQWKIDGDCKVCRRDSYCTKPCKLRKTRLDRIFARAVADKKMKLETQKEVSDVHP